MVNYQQGCCLSLFTLLDNDRLYFTAILCGLFWVFLFGSWTIYVLLEECFDDEDTTCDILFWLCGIALPAAPVLQWVLFDNLPKPPRRFHKLNVLIWTLWWAVVTSIFFIISTIKCPEVFSWGLATEGTVSPTFDPFTLPPSSSSSLDVIALGAFYDEANGINWSTETNWKTSSDICVWYGVQCDDDGKVVGLFLKNNNMYGSISSSIGLLTDLVKIDLDSNYLTGTIPSEIDNLKSLRIFEADDNWLSGPIPSSLASIKTLKEVYLQMNNFSGTMPRELCARRDHRGGELDTLIADCSGDGNQFGNEDIVCPLNECCSICQ